METVTDRIRRLGRENAVPSEGGVGVGQLDEREQAIIDRHTSKAPKISFLQKAARGAAEIELETRRQQREYAEKPQSTLAAITIDPAREMVANLGDRAKVLDTIRKLSPEQRQEALKLAPGIAQQLGDERGGVVGRTLGAVSRGISHMVSQPISEIFGLGGTPEEIEYIRQLDAAASQEFSPARPGDPWYERGPLQALEMAPWMATVVGGAGAGRAAATGVAGRIGLAARGTAAAAKGGELAGITAAAFPGQYAQEVDSLKALGMEDNLTMRVLAGGTAAIAGLIEGIVPNPFKAGNVPLTEGAVKAARQYLWNAAKQAPGEMSEEYLQGVTSGLGQHVAQYLDENAQEKSIADAFKTGWEQAKEAALPMAFLLGVPAVGGAVNAARLARLQSIRAKGFVSTEDAQKEGIEGKNRKQRLANTDKQIKQLEQGSDPSVSAGHAFPTTPTIPPYVAPPDGTQAKRTPWYDFGSGEPEGEIPPPPGLDLLDKLQGKSPKGPPRLPGAPGAAQATPPALPPGTPPALPGSSQPKLPGPAGSSPTGQPPGLPAPQTPQVPGKDDLRDVGKAGGAIVDNFYESIRQSLKTTGKVPGPERGSSVGQAWDAWKDKTDIDGFVEDLRKAQGTTSKEAPNASQVPANEGSTQVQGDAGQGSQVLGSSQVRGSGQDQGGAQPPSQEPAAPEVQVDPVAKAYSEAEEMGEFAAPKKPRTTEQLAGHVDYFRKLFNDAVSRGVSPTPFVGPGTKRQAFYEALASEAGGTLQWTEVGKDQLSGTFVKQEKPAAAPEVPAAGSMPPIEDKTGEQVGSKPGTIGDSSQWDVVKAPDGKLYRMDPNAKTPSERLKARQAVDPSEGVVLITKDQFGKPIPPETLKARQEFVDKAKPGALLNIKGFETSGPYRVMNAGKLLDTKTGRVMADVQERANLITPGMITWVKESPSTAGSSEEVGTKPTTGSPTVSPDAPATPETSKGKAEGENRSSEARADNTKVKKGWQPSPLSDVSIIESPDLKLETSRREKKDPQFPIDAGSPVTVYRRGSNGKEEMQAGVVEDFADHMPGNIKVRLSDGSLVTPLLVDVGPARDLTTPPKPKPATTPEAIADNTDDLRKMLADVNAEITKQGRVVDDRLLSRKRELERLLKEPAEKPKSPAPTESKWQSETRSKLEAVPALKGAKVEVDEKSATAKVTRPDGLSTTIHFNADEELAKAAKAKLRNPESIHGWYVREPGAKTGDIYLRSDANHTNILNHEVMHWLEDQGVVTKEEVEQYGGREAIAEKYGKWAELKQRKKDSVFDRIREFLEPVFSSQRRFFEEVSKRGVVSQSQTSPGVQHDPYLQGAGSTSQKTEGVGPSTTEEQPAEDDFTAAVNAAFDERFGGKATADTKPAKPKKISGRKDQQPREKKTLTEKAAARKERTSAAKAEKLAKFKDLLKQKKIIKAVYDPKAEAKADAELLAATVELTAAAIDDGVSTFAEYVAWIADNIGESATRTIAPYLEAGWNRLGTYDRFRGKIDKAGKVADILTEVSDETSPADYGTLEAPNRVALGKHFQRQLESGKDYKSIVEARKEAATLIAGDGASIEPGTPAAKAIDEAVEQGVVRAARSIAESGSEPLKVYDSLLDLYERQPRLNVRTGTSMRQQAYSTPAPAAWIASMLSDTSRDNTAYDSSAGNGMLLLGVDAENAIANELNPERAQALRELGYQVNEGDATKYTPEQQPDRIIINPPFGELEGQSWTIGGTTTDKIDHAIVLKTLESLPEDGKAVLIIGSKGFEQRQPKDELRRGEAYKNDKNFYNALYDGYNVTDHFTLHGDLYSKQGAAFPIDVIVIDGRGRSELPKPYQIDRQNAIPRVINSWEELRDVGERYLDTGTGRPSGLSTEPVTDDMGGLSSLLEGQGKGTRSRGRRSGKNTGRGGAVPPRGDAGDQQAGGDSGQSTVSGSPDGQRQSDSKSISDEGKPDGAGRRSRDAKRLDLPSADVEGDAETEFQVTYKKRSGVDGVGTLVPRTQARAVEQALEVAEDRYGNLDEFVSSELGYDKNELQKYFSAEQVDALALAIARHKEGKAFVLGDQTGVGKGRVAAGMMVYAKRQGLVPVFMTQSPDLYADMYRDLQDIGQHSENEPFYALTTNTLAGDKGKIRLPGGMELSQTAEFAKNTINALADSVTTGNGTVVMITVEKTTDAKGRPLGETPSGKPRVRKVQEQRDYDAVFTTYSQLQTVSGSLKERHTALSRIAPKAFFVLDESHNAGGSVSSSPDTQGTGTTAAELIRAMVNESSGVLFLSATYAKRADVMDLYAKTGMADSIEGTEEGLVETLQQGGIPLQQVLSEMLVESGAYMRRERSFEGIEFEAKIEDTGTEEAGTIAEIFGAIDRLDRIKNEIVKTKSFKRWLTSQGLGLGTDSATGRRGMESSTFSSIVHNLVNQMLLSIKADATADAAIASIKRGEAPVIALSNTMGSALNQYLETNPANVGDEIDFRFSRAGERYLERSREIMLTDVDSAGRRTARRVRLPDEVLGEDGIAAYNAAKELIDGFAADIPASPIDHIRNRIQEAGYTVREVTGRDLTVDYSEGKMRLSQRPKDETGSAGKLATVKAFNSGELDAMILNQSGSTGLSAHASKLNPPAGQKRRHMIVAQADANIDTFMQMLGRINRTGQVTELEGQARNSNLPHYTLLMTNVPAETRPAAVLIKKLSSLNANVTADSKGSVSFDAPDILNKVGDRVVAEYIADNPALNHALGDIVEVNHEGSPRVVPDIARKVSGRMAMRPIPEQQAFWDSVTETYAEEIEQLNKLGKNPLAATKMDLGARTLERVEIFAGDTTADSPFLQPAYADRVRVKKQGEPMTPEEIKSAVKDFYGIRTKRKRGPDPFGDMESELHRETLTGENVEQNVTEWTDDLGEAARKWADKQIEIATEAIESKAAQQVARLVNDEAIARVRSRADRIESAIRRRLNSVAPGMAVEVSEVQEEGRYSDPIDGIVIDVKAKKGKEHLPSGWIATIALSSPDRVLRVPFSRIETAGNSQPGDVYVSPSFELATDRMYDGWEETGDVYEERIIGTGNVLAAFDRLVSPESRGNIVFFTNEEGVSQRGVLMPRSFNLDRWAADRPVTFTTPQQVLDFISIDPGHQVNDPNFAIQFTLDGDTMNVRSPRSRQRSGRYTTNQGLIDASGTDFVSVGQILQMKVTGKKRQLAVIEAAQKLGPLIAANYKEDAKRVAGEPVRGGGSPGVVAQMKAEPTRQSRSERNKEEAEKAGIAAADIQKTAERLFDVAIRQGGFSQRAAGIYKWLTKRNGPPSPEVVRTAEDHYANLAVIAHEVAHHIDEMTKAVKSMPKEVRDEVKRLDYEPEKARAFEGWAEFLRRYMTEPPIDVVGRMVPNPGLDAPKTLAWFEGTFLQANPETAKAIAEFRRYAQQFAQQSVFQRAGTLIAERQPQDLKFSERWLHQARRRIHRMKTAFIDKFHTLEWIQKEAKERGHEGIGIYDLTMAHYMSASSHATIAFEEGVRSLQTGAPIGKTSLWSLRDHLESDREYNEAVLYSLARHTLFMDDTKRGYNTGMDVKDAEALIAEVKSSGKQKRYEAFAKALAKFNDDLIEMLVESGALPRKDADAMLRAYEGSNYFPLHRVQDADRSMFAGSGVGFVNLGSAVKKRSRKGSGRQIVDPIDATIARAMRFYGRAIQARQQQVLAETLDPLMGGVGGMGGLMDRVDPRRKVTQGTVDEILKTLVEEGIVEADDARAMRIASKILDPEADGPGADSIQWFAERHGIEEIDGEYDWADIEHAAESEPNALAVISLWRPDYTPSARKRTVIIYDKQGKPIMYEMDPDLYATATGMEEPQFNWFMSIFREAARYFKTGAVGASTGFGTANLLRDYWEFQGKARHTKGLSSLGKPPEMLGRYLAEKTLRAMPVLQRVTGVKPNSPLIRLYEESGGKVYSVVGHDVQSRRRYRRRRIGKSTMSKLGLSLRRPHDSAESILQGIQDVIAISDAPPRLADAEAALKEDGFVVRDGQWFDLNANAFVDHLPEATRIKASIAMAEATINFKRIGTYGQYVESFFPFFNATVQAMYRQYNQTKTLKSLGRKDTEGVQAKRYLVYLSALASTGVLYWLWRHDDDDWREQESYLRDGFWTWGKDGKTYYRIPKPRDSAVVSNVVENMLDAWYHDDARDMSDVVIRDFGGRIPTGGGFLRGLGETYFTNYDYFRERDLTPQALKDLPKEQQVESTTTRASQAMGQFTGRYLNTSPIQLEHLLNSSTGGFYRRMADLYDASVDGRIGPEHYPFLRGLMIDRHQARSVATFYETKDALDEQIKRDVVDKGKASDEAIGKLAVLEEYAEIMKAMRKAEGKLGKRRNYEFQPYIAGLARRGLGYSELKNNPDPFNDENVPEEIASVLQDYAGRAIVLATEPLKQPGEYDSEGEYEDHRKSLVRGKAKLESLGLSYDEARQALFAYWKGRWGSTTEMKNGRPVLMSTVKTRLDQLRKLYTEQSE